MALKLIRKRLELILMCGRVQTFEIEQSLWNLVNSMKEVTCGHPLEDVTFASHCMLNLFAL